jgi:hypothetical protein
MALKKQNQQHSFHAIGCEGELGSERVLGVELPCLLRRLLLKVRPAKARDPSRGPRGGGVGLLMRIY